VGLVDRACLAPQLRLAVVAEPPARRLYAAARDRVQRQINSQRERQRCKRQAQLRAQPSEERLTALCQKGELLLAYASQIEPGQETLD
jgi:predicted ribosome quality control (RQC) complex YloA/Tae2 family protein